MNNDALVIFRYRGLFNYFRKSTETYAPNVHTVAEAKMYAEEDFGHLYWEDPEEEAEFARQQRASAASRGNSRGSGASRGNFSSTSTREASPSAESAQGAAFSEKTPDDASDEVLPSGRTLREYAVAVHGSFSSAQRDERYLWNKAVYLAAKGCWTVKQIQFYVNGDTVLGNVDVQQILDTVDAEAVAVVVSEEGIVSLKPSEKLQALLSSKF